jgi:glycosyltransferase involved in cell wall biosynthesis
VGVARPRPRIAYLTSADARDRRAWSGIHYSMAEALQRHCGDVHHVGPVASPVSRWLQRADRALTRVARRRYNTVHSILLSLSVGRRLARRLAEARPDVIFASVASTEIATLATRVPIVYGSDGTFALLHDYYPWLSNLSRVSVWEGNWIERRAIARARAVVYSTQWAAASAVRDYHAAPGKIHVIPYGANVTDVPSRGEALARRRPRTVRMLFLGVDWERKGGGIALETLEALGRLGVPADLTVCGCAPPSGTAHPRLRVVPFLDKNVERDRKELARLLLESDLLLVPTRADCSPIVFCEASAFGLPVISTDTGGVSGVVRDGETGYLLPPSAGGADYAARIAALLQRDGEYEALVRSSRAAFEERLNWDAWAKGVGRVVDRVLHPC